MKYGVEVLTFRTSGEQVFNRHGANDYNHSLTVAQHIATSMFPEDPMATRTFRTGRVTYSQKNDFGELVVIRPFAEVASKVAIPAIPRKDVEHHGFFIKSSLGKPNEPA